MRKITLLLMLFSLVIVAQATVIVDELFDYNVSNLNEVTTWQHQPGKVTSGTGRTILSGGLEYSNAGGAYIYSGAGKTMKCDVKTSKNTAAEAFIAYKALPDGLINSGSIYLSFLYKPNGDQTQPGTDIIGLATTSAQTTFKACAARQADIPATDVSPKITGAFNPFRIGVNNSTAVSTAVYAENFFEKDLIYLIVVKYSFDSQTASLFVNPVIATTSEPTPDAITAEKAITSFEYLMFYSSGTGAQSNFNISGIRVATTWEEAVAAQAPAGLNNTSTSKLTIAGKTITASEIGMFDIYNLQGAKVLHVKNANTVNTNLATGLYILQYTDPMGRKLTQKITI